MSGVSKRILQADSGAGHANVWCALMTVLRANDQGVNRKIEERENILIYLFCFIYLKMNTTGNMKK